MTQMECAQRGIISGEMKTIAEREGLPAEEIRANIAAGHTVLL